MAKFCELGIESDVVIGKGIEIEELFGRRILIEKQLFSQLNIRERMRPDCECKCKSYLQHSMNRPTKTAIITQRTKMERPLVKGVLVLPGRTY